jgi:hypothetical protein
VGSNAIASGGANQVQFEHKVFLGKGIFEIKHVLL